ncbi:PQQ-dependent sugar dehydrogenase [Consotaella salsifontis]|uniref:Glucose/arabinose dehydrogenase, beta-propeller fold n=1 Tax=Consotaella salsifontis TaxID=1365950 RepID=A0A1T4T4Q4_9HYPH|nr:PQQ-dependent sugar dehydrogenase [Consotaella salsifontis]SKA35416.1 Glucose/arabinose dehydrogenase, beta-propeller fold [Consotaella salsifontis]
MRLTLSLIAAGSLLAFASAAPAQQKTAETQPPNAPGQTPAFPAQTRAPLPDDPVKVDVETVAKDLPHLWAMEFLPDGRMLVTAKKGEMYVVSKDGTKSAAIEGVPKVADAGQGGLLDVALSPNFSQDNLVFFSFSEPRDGGNGTSVGRARLSLGDTPRLEDVQVIFRQMPTYDGNKHFGSRLVFAEDGTLFATVGERSDTPIRDKAQDISTGLGKVFHMNTDGSPAKNNPFLDREDAVPQIWSYGHRNLQAAALGPDGKLWTVEHGPKGGDELNHPGAGKNYGWPIITYGEDYNGKPIGKGITKKDGMEQPVYYWDPVIGPSGMAFYQGDEFPAWNGKTILIGGLVSQGVVALTLNGEGRVASEQRIPLKARIRDVKVGPDGAVYAVTETRGGSSSILKLTRG